MLIIFLVTIIFMFGYLYRDINRISTDISKTEFIEQFKRVFLIFSIRGGLMAIAILIHHIGGKI